nr:hypothetical protein [Spirochaetota bacterium]
GKLKTNSVPPTLFLLSNGRNMSQEVLNFCLKHQIHLSMSLPGLSSYQKHIGGKDTQAGNILFWMKVYAGESWNGEKANHLSREFETILADGYTYKVNNVKYSGGAWDITLEVMKEQRKGYFEMTKEEMDAINKAKINK